VMNIASQHRLTTSPHNIASPGVPRVVYHHHLRAPVAATASSGAHLRQVDSSLLGLNGYSSR
jgi:hypothetical protein